MKFLLPLFVVFVIGFVNGFPHRNYATFRPCQNENSLQTLWPDFENNRRFFQCMAVNVFGIHDCPANLLFSFELQVCVWEHMWEPPPSPDFITPFPTTQWPPRDSTIDQEVTVPTGEVTVPGL
jgi:Chitin binding Peritrophin-A domain